MAPSEMLMHCPFHLGNRFYTWPTFKKKKLPHAAILHCTHNRLLKLMNK